MAPDESEQPAPRRRAHLGLGIRMVVSAVLLAVLVTKIDFEGALPKDRHLSTLLFFAAAVLTATIGIVLSAWRWQRVLLAFGAAVPLRALTGHYFAGQFVGNVLPSTIGGDVLRVSRSAKNIGSSETAFAAVALERLSGFLALPVLCLVGFIIDPTLLESSTAWVAILISGIALAALAAILLLAAHPRIAGRFRDHENWMRFIGAAHIGVERLRADPKAALAVLGTAMIYQVSVVLTVGFVILTIGAPVPVGAVIAFVPVVAMAQVIPISLSGLGVREGMFVLLLHPLGIANGQAIGIGLLWYLTMLLVSFLGAPAFAVGNRHHAAVGVGNGLVSTRTEHDAPKLHRRLWAAKVLRDGYVIYWWAEMLAIGLFYILYSAVRNADKVRTVAAYTNAKTLMGWQDTLGINHELTINEWALHFKPLVIAANYFYGSLHFVVTIGVAVYLFRKWPDDYPRWRNTLGVATVIALIGFRFWPLMPPRLLDNEMYMYLHPGRHYGFVDTLASYPTFWTFNSGAMKNISNQFAAMPSVHCCWALWCACALVPRLKHTWAKWLAAAYPVLTVSVIVITANHYFLDAVGGFAILAIGYTAARLFTRAGRGPAIEPEPIPTT